MKLVSRSSHSFEQHCAVTTSLSVFLFSKQKPALPVPACKIIFIAVSHPFNLLLMVLAAVSFGTGDLRTGALILPALSWFVLTSLWSLCFAGCVMVAMIVLSAGIRSYQVKLLSLPSAKWLAVEHRFCVQSSRVLAWVWSFFFHSFIFGLFPSFLVRRIPERDAAVSSPNRWVGSWWYCAVHVRRRGSCW